MAVIAGAGSSIRYYSSPPELYTVSSSSENLGLKNSRLRFARSKFFFPIQAMDARSNASSIKPMDSINHCADHNGKSPRQVSTISMSTNIVWHKCSVDRLDRQELLHQKGCVIWITGLSGSGKSTVACALGRALQSRGKLSYILDGDNVRHGLNQDLSFNAEDRAENIRRVGEVAKLFADSGVICIACLISPYRKDREACRALLPEGDFVEVFMDVPIQVCEARDSKGLYKLARAGKIKGFTGIDDPYEAPLNCEIKMQQRGVCCASPCEMAETVMSYLEENCYLQAKVVITQQSIKLRFSLN